MPRESFVLQDIIRDIPASDLEPNIWTGGNNVVMRRGLAQRASRGVNAFQDTNPVIGPPLNTVSSIDALLNAWLYPFDDVGGLGKGIAVTDGNLHKDITPASFTPWLDSTENVFTDGNISGLPFINWERQAAYWNRNFATPDLMVPMPGTDPAGADDDTFVP
ncbi:unnamed protein product, partial [marine sediment metagenome]